MDTRSRSFSSLRPRMERVAGSLHSKSHEHDRDMHANSDCVFLNRHTPHCAQGICHRPCGCEIALGHPTWRAKRGETRWTDLDYATVGKGGMAWSAAEYSSPPGTITNAHIERERAIPATCERNITTSIVHPPLDVRWNPRSRRPVKEEWPVYLEKDRRIPCDRAGFGRRHTDIDPWCRKPSHRAGDRWASRATRH